MNVNLMIKMESGFEGNVPKQAHEGDAGLDIMASLLTPALLKPGERRLISCGFSMALPEGFEAQMRPRSGLAIKKGISLVNSPGTIDSGYRGVVGAIVINHGDEPFIINNGDRIAQIVIAEVPKVKMILVSALPDSERGAGGFGSTGVGKA